MFLSFESHVTIGKVGYFMLSSNVKNLESVGSKTLKSRRKKFREHCFSRRTFCFTTAQVLAWLSWNNLPAQWKLAQFRETRQIVGKVEVQIPWALWPLETTLGPRLPLAIACLKLLQFTKCRVCGQMKHHTKSITSSEQLIKSVSWGVPLLFVGHEREELLFWRGLLNICLIGETCVCVCLVNSCWIWRFLNTRKFTGRTTVSNQLLFVAHSYEWYFINNSWSETSITT